MNFLEIWISKLRRLVPTHPHPIHLKKLRNSVKRRTWMRLRISIQISSNQLKMRIKRRQSKFQRNRRRWKSRNHQMSPKIKWRKFKNKKMKIRRINPFKIKTSQNKMNKPKTKPQKSQNKPNKKINLKKKLRRRKIN